MAKSKAPRGKFKLMMTVSARLMLASVITILPIGCLAKSPSPPDPWFLLDQITHKRTYTIQTRDHECLMGTIMDVAQDHLKVRVQGSEPYSVTEVNVLREDVLRVVSGRTIYYSGRSSWLDMSSIPKKGRQGLKVVTNNGKVYTAKPPFEVLDDGIAFDVPGTRVKVPKAEIALVYGVIVKPLTTKGAYFQDELGPFIIFDPCFYVYGLHLEQHVQVLLYRAGCAEDDSPSQCVWLNKNER